ncbi:MAG: transglutaminase-like cysteine peptidase [Alphaproteobacteria bacterium]|nr:transglutaminase-like cysteine peptidase [Alphaproteobacteria bacterium]MCB9975731.1 transglutaminase-like cysteine peptidase [Rhodospirillales bacterium]
MSRVLGPDFRSVSATFSIEDFTTDPTILRHRAQAVFDQYKLTQHWEFSPMENQRFNAIWDRVWEQFPEELKQVEGAFPSAAYHDGSFSLVSPAQAGKWSGEPIERIAARERAFMEALDTVLDDAITYTPDLTRADESQPLPRTLERMAGDCEDFAIAKYKFARRYGIDADRLAIVSVDAQPGEEGGGHAVLLYQDPTGEQFVLNNNSTNNSGLIFAPSFFQIRNDPYRAYNENGAYYNSLFSDMNYGDFVNEEGRTRGDIIVVGARPGN